jgi:sugar phosphate permease
MICCFANGYVRDSITYWATKLLMDTQDIDLGSAVGIILIIPCVNFFGIRMGQTAYLRTRNNVYLSSGILFAVCTVLCAVLGPVAKWSFIGCIIILVLISAMSYGLNPLLTTLMPMLYCHLEPGGAGGRHPGRHDLCRQRLFRVFRGFLSDRFGWSAVFISWAVLSLVGVVSLEAARRKAAK